MANPNYATFSKNKKYKRKSEIFQISSLFAKGRIFLKLKIGHSMEPIQLASRNGSDSIPVILVAKQPAGDSVMSVSVTPPTLTYI